MQFANSVRACCGDRDWPGHADGTLECVRVEFKTDARNERSRAALAPIPAQFEGVLRNHMIVPDIGQRDSAYFSVIGLRVARGRGQPRTPHRRRQPAHSAAIAGAPNETPISHLIGGKSAFRSALRGEPELVRVHDFKEKQLGKAIPHGAYDIAGDQG